jgi:hypothetical protein
VSGDVDGKALLGRLETLQGRSHRNDGQIRIALNAAVVELYCYNINSKK